MGRVHVIVVGCGRVGAELATELVRAGHETVVIDKAARSFRRLPPEWEGRTVVGFGFDQDSLEEADVKRADALAAVTSGDNSNVLTARIAKETYRIPQVVARIYDPRRAQIYQRLGIQTVASVSWTVDQALRRLSPDTTTTEWTDPSGQVVLVERGLTDSWCGQHLDRMGKGGRIRLVAVTRGSTALLPTPELMGHEGDLVHLALHIDALADMDQLLADGPSGARER